jgi:hypothetical protein
MSEVKRMKSTDGTIVYHLDGKIHNWDSRHSIYLL